MDTNWVNPWVVLDPLGYVITDIRCQLSSSTVENIELDVLLGLRAAVISNT